VQDAPTSRRQTIASQKNLHLSPPRSNKGSGRLCLHFLQAIRSVHSSAKKRRSSPLCRGLPPWQRDEWDPWASIIKRAASDKSKGHYAGPCGMTPNILYHLADIRDIISPMNGPFHSYKPDLNCLISNPSGLRGILKKYCEPAKQQHRFPTRSEEVLSPIKHIEKKGQTSFKLAPG